MVFIRAERKDNSDEKTMFGLFHKHTGFQSSYLGLTRPTYALRDVHFCRLKSLGQEATKHLCSEISRADLLCLFTCILRSRGQTY